ncbi:MAG: leucyl/phenylalanyl-tRNA--protein transferase [Bacteroidia bacterium]
MDLYYVVDDIFPESVITRRKDGLLAVGGKMSPDLVLKAYRKGIFHWFNEPEFPMWFSPNPRTVIYPSEIYISKSMKKVINSNQFVCTIDKNFEQLIRLCRTERLKTEGTWISEEIEDIYNILHLKGIAHSVEVWFEGKLVGGLYGVAMGKCFMGESMVSTMSNASKTAMIYLCKHLQKFDFHFVDCQVENPHLMSMGAVNIPRKDFLKQLNLFINSSSNAFDKENL